MASPFSIFRQNQWIMLAGMGVLLMIAFVIVPSVQMLMDTGRTRGDAPPVVEFRKIRTSIDEAQLQDMMRRRVKMIQFLASLREQVMLQQFPEQFRALMMQRVGPMAGAYAQSVFGPDSEQAVVMTDLLNKKADELGLVVSNGAINDFLKRESEGKVPYPEVRKIFESLDLTEKMLFEDLRYELKAMEVRQLVLEEPPPPDFDRFMRGQAQFDGITGVTPEQRYEYFERTSARVTLEVLPVKVETLASKEKEPAESVLREYFEKNKDKPQGNDLVPGFKVPYQAVYEYVLATPAKVDELAPRQPVTDADIVKFYEDNKDFEFEDRAAGLEDPLKNDPAVRPAEITPEKKGDESSEAPKAEDKKADEKKADEKKADEKKADEKKADDKKEPEAKKADDEAGGDCQDAAKDEKKPAEEKKPEEKKPAAEAKEEVTKKEDAKTPDEKKLPEPPAGPPAKKYKPLDDLLKGEIRKRLEREAAIRAIEKSLSSIRSNVMRKYGTQFYSWESAQTAGKKAEEPKRPDLKAVAEKDGLKYGITEPFSQLTSKDHLPLGMSFVSSSLPVNIDTQNMFVFRAFGGFQKFSPEYAMDDAGNRMVFWKVKEIEPHVPKYEEVKALVLSTWKTEQARKKAEELAKAFVTEAKPGESLTQDLGGVDREISTSLSLPSDIHSTIPEEKPAVESNVVPAAKPLVEALGPDAPDLVFTTRPFSWLISPMLDPQRPEAPRLNTVEGLDSIDDAFMKSVFDLKEGQLGYAWNRPKTVLYVVRVNRYDQALKFAFLRYGAKDYLPLAASDKFSFIQGRVEELVSEFGLEWLRDPRDRRR